MSDQSCKPVQLYLLDVLRISLFTVDNSSNPEKVCFDPVPMWDQTFSAPAHFGLSQPSLTASASYLDIYAATKIHLSMRASWLAS
jgi:hypothetical protein